MLKERRVQEEIERQKKITAEKQEKEKFEKERIEREKLAQERLERSRREQERKEQLARDREERERVARERDERRRTRLLEERTLDREREERRSALERVERRRTSEREDRSFREPTESRFVKRSSQGPCYDEDGFKIGGFQFGGLKPIPFDHAIDPLPEHCFRCWEVSHQHNHCPRRSDLWHVYYCYNCGRKWRTLDSCERCGDAHREHKARMVEGRVTVVPPSHPNSSVPVANPSHQTPTAPPVVFPPLPTTLASAVRSVPAAVVPAPIPMIVAEVSGDQAPNRVATRAEVLLQLLQQAESAPVSIRDTLFKFAERYARGQE